MPACFTEGCILQKQEACGVRCEGRTAECIPNPRDAMTPICAATRFEETEAGLV